MKYFYDQKLGRMLAFEEGVGLREIPEVAIDGVVPPPVTDEQEKPMKFKKKAVDTLLRKSPKGSKREEVMALVAKGWDNNRIAEKVGISPAGVYYYTSSKVTKQQEQRKEAKASVAKNSDNEEGDFGLGFSAIGIIVDMKRNSEKTDAEIAQEMDITVSQMRAIYSKWSKDARFKPQFN